MSIWFYLFVAMIVVLIVLFIEIIITKNEIKNIEKSFSKIIELDTNNLITVGTSSKEIKDLVNSLNKDLKKLRKLELEYKNGNQELKSSITNISHDMRTPLTAINGYIDLLKEEESEDKKKEYLEVIERKTKDLISLTENLFDFAKTVDIGENIEKENCLVNEILEEALSNYYTIFKEKNIIPEINICEEKIYRKINKNSMIRVFENILSNAGKYSDGDLKIKLEESGKITFSNKASLLDLASVQRIFNKYFTLENGKEKSNGLGLSIAKQLVELNSGKIFANYINNVLIIEIIL